MLVCMECQLYKKKIIAGKQSKSKTGGKKMKDY